MTEEIKERTYTREKLKKPIRKLDKSYEMLIRQIDRLYYENKPIYETFEVLIDTTMDSISNALNEVADEIFDSLTDLLKLTKKFEEFGKGDK